MDPGLFISAVLTLLLGLSQAQTPLEQPSTDDISTTILEANRDISHLLMGGDLALPNKRNAMTCWQDYCRWTKSPSGLVEVPYTISSYFYDSEKAIIEKAMEMFHAKTCVRFVPYTSQPDYISIESKTGCWSVLGRTGGKQQLSLSISGCVKHGVVQHELLHALGFNHEQTRSDRDQYVRINWEHIHKANAYNFQKRNTNNLNTPYDYSSVMHYGRTSFGMWPGDETITPIPDSTVEIGQRDNMSTIDIQRINTLYECGM